MGRVVMILALQRQGIRRTARQQHLFPRHPARDLRQAHRLTRHTGRINRIGHVQFGIVGHHLGGLGQGLLERISRIVVLLHHVQSPFVLRRPAASKRNRIPLHLAKNTSAGGIAPGTGAIQRVIPNSQRPRFRAVPHQSSADRTRPQSDAPAHRTCSGRTGGTHNPHCGKSQHSGPS